MLAVASWCWLVGVGAAAVFAVFWGGEPRPVAAAAALALAPALTGFILLPRLGKKWPAAGLISVWLISAAGLVAGTGVGSPLIVTLVIAPAVASVLGRWMREAAVGAVVAYLAALYLTRFETIGALGPFTMLLSLVSLAFVAGLLAAHRRSAKHGQAIQRIAEVSHELRTPLTHILGFAEMIERQLFGELSGRYVEYAGLIRKSGAHLLGLVNDLLDLSKIEAGRYDLERGTFDVRAVIEDVVRLSIDSAEKKQIALGMVTSETPLNVHADDRAVKRMLINTVGNAIKFTPEGGRVIVQAAANGGALQLDTIDNGPGIPEAERTKLGQAFERGSGGARAEGTGLGLALVRALAALHGGALSFHEAPGGGALVRITLPVLSD